MLCIAARKRCQRQENSPKSRAAGSFDSLSRKTQNGQEDKNLEAEKKKKVGVLESKKERKDEGLKAGG